MGAATEGSFAVSPTADRLRFAMPRALAATYNFSPGAWRLRPMPRRQAGMWQVRDGRNDVVADVYDKADAQLMVSSKALLLTSVKLLNILRQLALDGRLTREEAAQVHDAIEVVRRTMKASDVTPPPRAPTPPTTPPSTPTPTRPPAVVAVPTRANAKDIDLDPAFRTWCAQQYRSATAQGLPPLSWSELRERYLGGER